MSELGRRLIEGLRDFNQTLRRGEALGIHYPISVYAKCWQCGEFRHIDLEDGRCGGCAQASCDRH